MSRMYIRRIGTSISKSYSSMDIYDLFNKMDFEETLGIYNRENKECRVLNEYKDMSHYKMYTVAKELLTLEDTVPDLTYRVAIQFSGLNNPRECLCTYQMLHSFDNPSRINHIRRALQLPVEFGKTGILVDISMYYTYLSDALRIWPDRHKDGRLTIKVPYEYLSCQERGEQFNLENTFDVLCSCIRCDASEEWQKIMEEQLPNAIDLI